jgi:hypothetical protein
MGRRRLGLILSLMLAACAAGGASAQELAPRVPVLRDALEPPKFEDPAVKAPEPDVKVSPNTNMPQVGQPGDFAVIPLVQHAMLSNGQIDPRYVANSQFPDDLGIWERTRNSYGDQGIRVLQDARRFYLSENMLYVGGAVLVAAPIANSHADQGIRDWYQRQAGQGKNRDVDEWAKVGKWFGEHKYTIPIYCAMSLSGHLFPDSPVLATAGDFGDRTLRAMIIGAPMVGVLQYGLGSQRPFANDSRWHPFEGRWGASGHTFIGALPFLTAASMVESRPLKALLIAGSMWTGWSRVHNDDHYFSQVFLGWSIAYLATEAVNHTDFGSSRLRVIPMTFPNGAGMGIQIDY